MDTLKQTKFEYVSNSAIQQVYERSTKEQKVKTIVPTVNQCVIVEHDTKMFLQKKRLYDNIDVKLSKKGEINNGEEKICRSVAYSYSCV